MIKDSTVKTLMYCKPKKEQRTDFFDDLQDIHNILEEKERKKAKDR
jgi:hypothetical protein